MIKVGRNDPCPCGSGKKYKHCCYRNLDANVLPFPTAHPEPAPASPLTLLADPATRPPRRDLPQVTPRRLEQVYAETYRRMISGELKPDENLYDTLDEILVEVAERVPTTPAEQALELTDQASMASGRKRERLIRQALALDPECAEAHLLLGRDAPTPEAALPHLERALSAAERAVGRGFLELEAGNVGGEIARFTYFDVRFTLAQALAALGRHAEAADHARELIRLDPLDETELGVPEFLLVQLMQLGEYPEADELMRRFPDEEWPFWQYSRALVKYRLLGDSLFSRRALQQAVAADPAVPPYLLGEKKPPKRLPLDGEPGPEAMAQVYAAVAGKYWAETPGALDWLREGTSAPADQPAAADVTYGPSFYLNPYDDLGFTRCPECDQKTKVRQRHVAVAVEPNLMLAANLPCRYCPTDDLLIAKQSDLEASMAAALRETNPEAIGKEYVCLGVIEGDDMRQIKRAESDPGLAIQHIRPFRDYYDYDDDELDDEDWDLDWEMDPILPLPDLAPPPAAENRLTRLVTKLRH